MFNNTPETDDARERREHAMYDRLDAIYSGQPEPPVGAMARTMERYPFLTADEIQRTTDGVKFHDPKQWTADVAAALAAANEAKRTAHGIAPDTHTQPETLAMTTTTRKRPTLAQLKAFIRRNCGRLFIEVESRFDGMTDMVEDVPDRSFVPLDDSGLDFDQRNTYGLPGVWVVHGGDLVETFEADGYTGYRAYNCCGSFRVATLTKQTDPATSRPTAGDGRGPAAPTTDPTPTTALEPPAMTAATDRLNGTACDPPGLAVEHADHGGTRDLDAALLACQRQLRVIGRDGYNAHSDYGYTSADHWIAESRDVLHRHDLMARRERWTVTPWGDRAIIAATFTVTHVPSGQRLALDTSLAVEDRKGTPIDKAILAGLTSLWAYTLRDLLLVPRCDGNELDALNDADHQPVAETTTAEACRAALVARGIPADDADGIVEWFRASTGGTPNRATRQKFRGDIDAGVFDRWMPPVATV